MHAITVFSESTGRSYNKVDIVTGQTPLFHLLSIAHAVDDLALLFENYHRGCSGLLDYRFQIGAWFGAISVLDQLHAISCEPVGIIGDGDAEGGISSSPMQVDVDAPHAFARARSVMIDSQADLLAHSQASSVRAPALRLGFA